MTSIENFLKGIFVENLREYCRDLREDFNIIRVD